MFFKCKYCRRDFHLKSTLVDHMTREHENRLREDHPMGFNVDDLVDSTSIFVAVLEAVNDDIVSETDTPSSIDSGGGDFGGGGASGDF